MPSKRQHRLRLRALPALIPRFYTETKAVPTLIIATAFMRSDVARSDPLTLVTELIFAVKNATPATQWAVDRANMTQIMINTMTALQVRRFLVR